MDDKASGQDEGEERHVCFQCIGEEFLSSLVETNGAVEVCSYCVSSDLETFTLAELASEVAKVFDHSWTTTPRDPDAYESALLRDRELKYEWSRQGISAEEVVEDVANDRNTARPEDRHIVHEHLQAIERVFFIARADLERQRRGVGRDRNVGCVDYDGGQMEVGAEHGFGEAEFF